MTDAMTDAVIVQFESTTKAFNDVVALRDITLTVPAGAVVGVIGRNGSGKSTLLHYVNGLQLPTSGAVRTFGVPTAELTHEQMARIGAVHQHSEFPQHLRLGQLMGYVRSFHARWDSALERGLLDRLQLNTGTKVSTLTPGNRQRLAVLLALCPRPALLLLDEPFSDLDPEMRQTLLALLMEQYAEDRPTMLLSSHLLHDIEPVITHVLALDRGAITYFDEFDAGKERHGANLEQLFPIHTQANPPVATGVSTGAA